MDRFLMIEIMTTPHGEPDTCEDERRPLAADTDSPITHAGLLAQSDDAVSLASFHTAYELTPLKETVPHGFQETASVHSSMSTSSVACRNCWDNEGDLITPCHCAGTNGFVHRECLEAWLRQSGLRQCNVCGQSFPVECRLKPFREWKIVPKCDHRVILFCGLTLTTLFLIGWLLYGIISTLLRDHKDDLDVTHYTISFVWLGVIIVTWIPLFIGTRKHLVQTYRNWMNQNQLIHVVV